MLLDPDATQMIICVALSVLPLPTRMACQASECTIAIGLYRQNHGGWTLKAHMVAADARASIMFVPPPGNTHDARKALLSELPKMTKGRPLLLSVPMRARDAATGARSEHDCGHFVHAQL